MTKLKNQIIKVTYVDEDTFVKNGVTIPYTKHKAILQDGRKVSFMMRETIWPGFRAVNATLEEHPKWGLQLKRVKVKDYSPDGEVILKSGIMKFLEQ